ncbi:protein-glutamate methylesterase/protein-glutamine glutaminase [Paenibacillus contaminans]|uniref:Protein-glutamate methylesterase/protein-glutamine glutaminase n=1 Tax=Paenibacillus contaminans TaxID=450362 RepID=A0A329MS09_9BACL|nr:chemotaxis response regulator protein-glutamate methylesterase [Paenibacillus contaminans]RAV22725.1 chemotaxis response regulator protein-glutamate methylesterase [Paenibacillus contaminans]
MPYRVLVVDDSVFMRKMISDMIAEHPQFTVVAAAKNGNEAVEFTKQYKPDVITMDVEMPEMNGLDALRIIMKEHPTPVVMLSSLTQEGANETILALEWGAVDFVRKPSGSISLDIHKVKALIHEKLLAAAASKVRRLGFAIPQARPVVMKPPEPAPSDPTANLPAEKLEHLVAIGTSTGGPRALQQVLVRLPASFKAPIMIVQHMPPNFTKSLAQRLDSVCGIRVVEAADGMPLRNGTAYIAPGGFHMTLVRDGSKGYKVRITKDELRSGHRPSVDKLFESLVSFTELRRHIVLMTGMGSDGAAGMAALKQSGAETTIAEAEETCVVYGMPRAAVEKNAVMHILPQQDIPAKLIQTVMH